ncbi:MAG: cbb3-type cytochrome c oxidase subunit 3 [Pseudomonadota bacterium]
MTPEALIGYSEAAFVAIALVAIVFLVLRVYHPGNRDAMEDHANIPFRGEDAPEPPTNETPTARQKTHG